MNKKPSVKIFKKAEFDFGHFDNAQRVAVALSLGGYFVKISNDLSIYTVLVYSTNEK